MAVNLEQLSAATLTATTLANLILVSPQKNIGIKPKQQGALTLNVPSFLFHINGTDQVALSSDITDHYIEDNTAINDHITFRPEIVTVQGYIGELNNVTPEILQPVRLAAEKLTIINAFTPSLSLTALRAYNIAEQLYRTANNAADAAVAAWNSISNSQFGTTRGQLNEIGSNGLVTDNGNQTKQQKAFQQLYGYYKKGTLFKVQTPWAVFDNMVIQNMVAIQDEETTSVSDFKLEFKMIRFASTEDAYLLTTQGRFANQGAPEVSLGQGNTTFTSDVSNILAKLPGV